jgi:hypothetical protein
LPDRWNQLGRHDHHRLPLGIEGHFVLGNGFIFGLVLVMISNPADSLFIPPARELLMGCSCFLGLFHPAFLGRDGQRA